MLIHSECAQRMLKRQMFAYLIPIKKKKKEFAYFTGCLNTFNFCVLLQKDSGQCHHNRFRQSRQSSPGRVREDPRYLQIVTERSVMIYVDLAIIIQPEIINGIING